MKNVKISYLFLIFFGLLVRAQVGIGTSTPKTTFDINGVPTSTMSVDGLMIPKITGNELAVKNITPGVYGMPQMGTIIYVTAPPTTPSVATKTENITVAGTYFWDGTSWMNSNTNNYFGLDVGFVMAWTTQTTPPAYLLPLAGGTYNKTDYPELMALHAKYPITLIASETATTFTLTNINNNSYLKGGLPANVGTIAGNPVTTLTLTQANLPSVSLFGSVDNGGTNHTHGVTWPNNSFAVRRSPGGSNTTTGADVTANEPMLTGDWNRRATVNNDGAHTHTLSVAINPGAQTSIDLSPLNTTIRWVIKAKPTNVTNGNITTNNIPLTPNSVTSVEILDGTIARIDIDPALGVYETGDVKYSMRNTDHFGWVLMNGRSCGAATLTASQQLTCLSLAFPGNNLPQTSGGGQNTATYLADRDGSSATRGSIGGDTDNLWTAANLPQHTHNIDLPNSGMNGAGLHNHGYSRMLVICCGGYDNGPGRVTGVGRTTSTDGFHGHTVDVPSGNTNGGNGLVAANASILPRTLDSNLFVYLGM